MKIVSYISLPLVLTLSACNTLTIDKTVNTTNTPEVDLYEPVAITEQLLMGTWQLQSDVLIGGDDKPLTVHFNHDTISVVNGCNNITANYHINGHRLTAEPAISTRMLCGKSLMMLDDLTVNLLKNPWMLEKNANDVTANIRLKATTNGMTYKFVKIR